MTLPDIFAPLGPDCVGVAPFAPLSLLPVRSRGRIPPGAASVIVCLFPYYVGPFSERNLSRYAILPDYHNLCGQMLEGWAGELRRRFPQNAFAPFVDASPIPEVEAARLTGLGVVGQNGQLIHPRYGSYVFVGEIVTDLPLTVGAPTEGACLGCGRCLRACPTGALGCGTVDTARCRSHITQKKGALTPWEEEQVALGGMAWGCDICTDCCPHNRDPLPTPIAAFYEHILPKLSLENLPEGMENRAFHYRGEQVLRRNLEILQRRQG